MRKLAGWACALWLAVWLVMVMREARAESGQFTATYGGYVNGNYSYDSEVYPYIYNWARYMMAGTGRVVGTVRVGQQYYCVEPESPWTHYAVILRSYLTIPIPVMTGVTSATLYLYCFEDHSATDFNIGIYSAQEYGSGGLTTSDYSRFNGWRMDTANPSGPPYSTTMQTYNGTRLNDLWNSSGYNGSWIAITFNAAGLDSVMNASGDSLRIALLSMEDVNHSKPAVDTDAGKEYLYFQGSSGANKPYLSLTYSTNLFAPRNVAASAAPGHHDSLDVTWSDPNWLIQEQGYQIETYPGGSVLATVGANVTSARVGGGFLPNSQYTLAVRTLAAAGDDSLSAPDSGYTDPRVPGIAPDIDFLDYTTIKVVIDTTGTGNPADTEYAIRMVTTIGTYYIDASADTLRMGLTADDDWGWRTYDQWGGASGVTAPVEVGREYSVSFGPRTKE